MRLRYLGTGTVFLEGAGEVSTGGVIDAPDALAQALLVEQPGVFEEAGGEAPTDGAAELESQPRARRGR
jgi:hypothetical protein